ncbi:MAG: DUF5654 family protein [Patescibacteria group bacterium]
MDKIKKKSNELRMEFLKTMISLATAGFGLAAALAWNETIQAVITEIIPEKGSAIWSKLIYALIVTGIAVLVTYSLGKMIQKEENEAELIKK